MARHATRAVTSILCPVDFSAHSRAALRYAAFVAREAAADLTVLYVNDPLLVAAAAITIDQRAIERRSRDELTRFVASSMPSMRGVRVNIEQATGDTAPEILVAARRHRCDLLVMGTGGLSGLGVLFFGSTTHDVVRKVSVPVAIVDRAVRTRPAQGCWPGKRILVPLDLGGGSERDARIAAALAASCGGALILVHAVAPAQPPPWYGGDRSMIDRLIVTRARTRLAAIASRLGVSADARVEVGQPAAAIAAIARRTRCDAVVMRIRPGEGVRGARAGSIAFAVVRDAHVPVLLLPGGGRSSRETAR